MVPPPITKISSSESWLASMKLSRLLTISSGVMVWLVSVSVSGEIRVFVECASEDICLAVECVSGEICAGAGAWAGFSKLLGSLLVITIFLRSFNLPGSDSQVARPITTLCLLVVSRKNFMSSLTWKMRFWFLPISRFLPMAEIRLNT